MAKTQGGPAGRRQNKGASGGGSRAKTSNPVLEELARRGISPAEGGKNWERVIQGAIEPQGFSSPVQLRLKVEGGARPPRLEGPDLAQADAVLAWFEADWPREKALEEVAAMASERMERARRESAQDASKLARTLAKALGAGQSVEDLEETIEAAFEQWSDNWRIRRQAGELEKQLSLDAYPSLFPMARAMGREIEIFTGPTNSGKTYAGMGLLSGAQSGAYLAPLRLLAMEGQDALIERGLKCSLVTGEERKLDPEARFVASTVEMADFSTPLDAAVIDEAQMLADKDRGWAWTAAILGLPARRLAIVCAPEAVEMVTKLLARAGEVPKVHRFERKTPLEALHEPVGLNDIRQGDALIAFSRRNALMWRDRLVGLGKKVAVIYGALAPEVRRGEAKRFAQGEADVLVATDAIGMGLNLPIKRVVLSTASKFDGQQTRELEIQELRQIAGRAGRYGVAERGYAGALEASDAKILAKALAGESLALDGRASIAPNDDQVEQMSATMKVERLAPILSFFKDHLVKSDKLFKASDMDDMIELAWRADKRLGLDLRSRFAFAKTPLDRNDEEHVKRWETWMRQVEQGKAVEAPTQPESPRGPLESDRLWECERAMKLLSAYCWLSWRFESSFPQRAQAEQARADLTEAIEGMLGRMGQAKNVKGPAPAQGGRANAKPSQGPGRKGGGRGRGR